MKTNPLWMATCLTKEECDVCGRKETIIITLGIMQKGGSNNRPSERRGSCKEPVIYFLPREAIFVFSVEGNHQRRWTE
jgi:hypothetical protein